MWVIHAYCRRWKEHVAGHPILSNAAKCGYWVVKAETLQNSALPISINTVKRQVKDGRNRSSSDDLKCSCRLPPDPGSIHLETDCSHQRRCSQKYPTTSQCTSVLGIRVLDSSATGRITASSLLIQSPYVPYERQRLPSSAGSIGKVYSNKKHFMTMKGPIGREEVPTMAFGKSTRR